MRSLVRDDRMRVLHEAGGVAGGTSAPGVASACRSWPATTPAMLDDAAIVRTRTASRRSGELGDPRARRGLPSARRQRTVDGAHGPAREEQAVVSCDGATPSARAGARLGSPCPSPGRAPPSPSRCARPPRGWPACGRQRRSRGRVSPRPCRATAPTRGLTDDAMMRTKAREAAASRRERSRAGLSQECDDRCIRATAVVHCRVNDLPWSEDESSIWRRRRP